LCALVLILVSLICHCQQYRNVKCCTRALSRRFNFARSSKTRSLYKISDIFARFQLDFVFRDRAPLKSPISNFVKIRPVGASLYPYEQASRRTDGHDTFVTIPPRLKPFVVSVVTCFTWVRMSHIGRSQLKCDGSRTEIRFRLSAKRTSPFKSAGASLQSTTGSRGVRMSGSNAGYTMFRGSVNGTGYPLHSPVSPSLPLPASPCAFTFQLESNPLN